MTALAFALAIALATQDGETATKPWTGPARICGYATIIDLADGEQLAPSEGGVHSAKYRWSGRFGAIDVWEINWASSPREAGRVVAETDGRRTYRKRAAGGQWRYAIWDKGHLTAYLTSAAFDGSTRDLILVDRVALFDHAGGEAKGCKYRLTFSW